MHRDSRILVRIRPRGKSQPTYFQSYHPRNRANQRRHEECQIELNITRLLFNWPCPSNCSIVGAMAPRETRHVPRTASPVESLLGVFHALESYAPGSSRLKTKYLTRTTASNTDAQYPKRERKCASVSWNRWAPAGNTGITLRTWFSQSPGSLRMNYTAVAAEDEIYLGNTTNRGTRIWKFSVIK